MARPLTRASRTSLIVACALVALLALAPASEARRRVPVGYFGANFGGPQLNRATDAALDAQFARAARAGVESLRVGFTWSSAQPYRTLAQVPPRARPLYTLGVGNVPTSFASTDHMVRLIAKHRIGILPLVIGAPRWASSTPMRGDYFVHPAANVADGYDLYLRTLIARYGNSGTFWKQNPKIPKKPIREWQIWNEPGFRYYWADPNYTTSYPRLLRAAYTTVHRYHGGKVIAAGLANNSQVLSWRDLAAFYRHGLRGHFDAIALHPFGVNLTNVIKIIKKSRAVINRHGGRSKPIYLTELSWPGSVGLLRHQSLGFERTPRAQRKLLAQAYAKLYRVKGLRIRRVYWYTWASTFNSVPLGGQVASWNYAGLVRVSGPLFKPTKLLTTYTRTARRYEGCAKTSTSRCKR